MLNAPRWHIEQTICKMWDADSPSIWLRHFTLFCALGSVGYHCADAYVAQHAMAAFRPEEDAFAQLATVGPEHHESAGKSLEVRRPRRRDSKRHEPTRGIANGQLVL